MKLARFTLADVPYITHLQPEGWLPISPYYQFYSTTDFCYPIKCLDENKIVGLGTAILHEDTGWLAHIIVDSALRNRGIGTLITRSLMDRLSPFVNTMSLLATPLGEPVYHKLGFEKETVYSFFRDGKTNGTDNKIIQSFHPKYKDDLLRLDKMVSGENRTKLLELHLINASIALEGNDLTGFFMPTLGEGLVVATTKIAGELLLNLKHISSNIATVPMENKAAVEFLVANGFVEFRKAIRMWYGKKLTWHADKLYGRIGGNLG